MREEAVVFGKTTPLVGILTDPLETREGADLPGVIFLNAGIVHRVGPNRLYVKMARSLAALGLPVLRFDLSGIGDSPVRSDHLPFDRSAVNETRDAMDYLEATRGVHRFVLAGICSGANLSYRTARCDSRVAGAVLINPRYHLHSSRPDPGSAIRSRVFARHYWRIAFFSSFSSKIWANLVTGRVRRRSVTRAVRDLRIVSLLPRSKALSSVRAQAKQDIRSMVERGVQLLHIYCEGDEGLDYFCVVVGNQMERWKAEWSLRVEIIRGANHTFTLLWTQERLLDVLRRWAESTILN